MKQFTFIVSGNVQKAGYRDRVIELGKFANLTGYAENLPDGRVRIIAEGDDDQLEFYKEHIDIKNTLIQVDKIEYTESEATNKFSSFSKLVSNDETDARLDTAANLLKELIGVTRNGFVNVTGEIKEMRTDIKEMRTDIKDMRTDIKEMHSDMKTGFNDLKFEIQGVKNEIRMQRDDLKDIFIREVNELHIEINEIKATLARMQTA
jgi:acylphosphatase